MSTSAKLSPVQLVAKLCCGWSAAQLTEAPLHEEDLEPLRALLSSPLSATEIAHIGNKLHNDDKFLASRQDIIARWAGQMDLDGVMSEPDAEGFVTEFFADIDHGALFDSDISANVSLVKRGRVYDSDVKFTGGMPCWTMHLTTSGEALFLNEQMEMEVTRGDMLLFHPDARYHYGLHPGAEHWEHLWVLFQPRSHWNDWLEWETLDNGIFQLRLPNESAHEGMERLLRDLITMGADTGPYRSDLQHSRFEEILIRAKQFSSTAKQSSVDKLIDEACNFMLANLAEKFSVDDVANACNLSTSRLAHRFKQQIGISPKSWCNNMRMQQARKLLLASEDSIVLIARYVGYDDQARFSRNFRKAMGCSPSEFRRAFKKESSRV
ncbi:MAG: arabinose operon transcriptional regulator AraC [Halioglobus sp.]